MFLSRTRSRVQKLEPLSLQVIRAARGSGHRIICSRSDQVLCSVTADPWEVRSPARGYLLKQRYWSLTRPAGPKCSWIKGAVGLNRPSSRPAFRLSVHHPAAAVARRPGEAPSCPFKQCGWTQGVSLINLSRATRFSGNTAAVQRWLRPRLDVLTFGSALGALGLDRQVFKLGQKSTLAAM